MGDRVNAGRAAASHAREKNGRTGSRHRYWSRRKGGQPEHSKTVSMQSYDSDSESSKGCADTGRGGRNGDGASERDAQALRRRGSLSSP